MKIYQIINSELIVNVSFAFISCVILKIIVFGLRENYTLSHLHHYLHSLTFQVPFRNRCQRETVFLSYKSFILFICCLTLTRRKYKSPYR